MVEDRWVEPRVRDEDRERQERPEPPDEQRLALAGLAPHPCSAARSASATIVLVALLEACVEGKRQRAAADPLGHRAHALAKAVPLTHVALQVDAREVAGRLHTLRCERLDHPLAVGALGELDHVDEPRPPVILVVGARQDETVGAGQKLVVPRGHGAPPGENQVQLLELAQADRRADVVDPVVEAEPRVVEPPAAVGPALVAQALEQEPRLLRPGRDDATLARRDLLVGIEREDRVLALSADRPPLVDGAERLAGIVDQCNLMALADRLQFFQLARIAEDVDADDGSRAWCDRRLDGRRVEVERARVDIGEDRRRAFVDRAVGRRDERVRRRDHLVTGLDAGRDAEQVQAGGAAGDRRCVRRLHRRGKRLLEAVDRRAERQPARPQHLDDELLLPLVEPGRRQPDLPRPVRRGGSARWDGGRVRHAA